MLVAVIGCSMPERIQSGQYKVGEKEADRRDPPKTIGVIKGEVANETRGSGFSRIMGVSNSKWYVYECVEHLRQYHDRSGTGVLIVASLEHECDSKSEAVEKAKGWYNL